MTSSSSFVYSGKHRSLVRFEKINDISTLFTKINIGQNVVKDCTILTGNDCTVNDVNWLIQQPMLSSLNTLTLVGTKISRSICKRLIKQPFIKTIHTLKITNPNNGVLVQDLVPVLSACQVNLEHLSIESLSFHSKLSVDALIQSCTRNRSGISALRSCTTDQWANQTTASLLTMLSKFPELIHLERAINIQASQNDIEHDLRLCAIAFDKLNSSESRIKTVKLTFIYPDTLKNVPILVSTLMRLFLVSCFLVCFFLQVNSVCLWY